MTIKTQFVTDEYLIEDAQEVIAVLKALRHQKGVTQQFLADRLQLSQKTVSALERNANNANFSRIVTLLDLLDAEIVIRKKH